MDLELLAPARNAEIGIAAIDCGADAVYIAGPAFGARKAAGNPIEDIALLCGHAHKFGARVFVTVNISLRDDELQTVHEQMLLEQAAGVDAFIIRDTRICGWEDITVPLHASTQCAIRDVRTALEYRNAGCGRIVLERELSLDRIKEISAALDCEVECFVHGALCVCYSGDCRLSEFLDGRSADRGECIQACRSLYDLCDGNGRVLVRNKALLSLKDLNLHDRLAELADAGICSFKIEGRLKNVSYVRNITRYYSDALDALVAANPGKYRRASFGSVSGGTAPDPYKTFNRGYTELYLDGTRSAWSSMDAPKSMGERVGTVESVRRMDGARSEITLSAASASITLNNGDGFAFVSGSGITGFRADVCEGRRINCREVAGLKRGTVLYRNIDAAFERALEKTATRRDIDVAVSVRISGSWNIELTATSEDGRQLVSPFKADLEKAENRERAEAMLREQLGKRSGIYRFRVTELESNCPGGALPLLSASTINSMRRLLAEDLDSIPVEKREMMHGNRAGAAKSKPEASPAPAPGTPADRHRLMISRYCIRYELGMCPRYQGAKESGPLYLLNNGRRLDLRFDCAACEMSVYPAATSPGK